MQIFFFLMVVGKWHVPPPVWVHFYCLQRIRHGLNIKHLFATMFLKSVCQPYHFKRCLRLVVLYSSKRLFLAKENVSYANTRFHHVRIYPLIKKGHSRYGWADNHFMWRSSDCALWCLQHEGVHIYLNVAMSGWGQ